MDDATEAGDLRDLLSVAKKLRHLAEDTLLEVDHDLCVNAAAALEARAQWLATHLPGDLQDHGVVQMHQPVDLLV